ncbi:MAG: hypothetical protein ACD_22C00047G0016 [uncultured bacterium]|nr:MAG: hypothetical protein ACD_22C00047G0016 [uncultured bacterium]
MANDKQYKIKTKYIGTRGVDEFRATIAEWVKPDDVILEIGCEWGTTSVLIAEKCKNLVATDVSSECIERAKKTYPGIRFETLDIYDIKAAMALNMKFTKIYVDVSGFSGYRSLLDVLSVLNMYASVFEPEAIIIKSGAIKQFARNLVAWESKITNE